MSTTRPPTGPGSTWSSGGLLAELTNQQIRRGVHRSVRELEAAIREFIAAHNEAPKPFLWAKTADQILASIARYAQFILAAQSRQLISRTTGTGDWPLVFSSILGSLVVEKD